METTMVLHVEDGQAFRRLKDRLLSDETVNRASIVFKDARAYAQKVGNLIVVSGTEDRLKAAAAIARTEKTADGKPAAAELAGKEKKEILAKLKEEEDRAIEGMGGIFG
jgi:cell division septum initiation protein DivIVA